MNHKDEGVSGEIVTNLVMVLVMVIQLASKSGTICYEEPNSYCS